ncbi:hypothetical protein EMIHUDRAFT_240404 [Emiliania huxleyi CCMP1516]|uniref:Citrate transporter-like domain-containing protein n=2 Tax=Emiliania huxleyi TaxID=2903 RepID=A0A0D3JFU5_EMIH1|nr:hypothetical protein EMIHUDRAFT_240404 [Emiliania huxleyi CCMP1516]EOD22380.1 hypothetical protein EMIHUDRAFT_240404 [Emiliania huxleyi CCMP1516]|eukprot:XP_005774809.1 hypothetical protein EMIHUDRAFT_240404 [Emiliania huxleyi CCMP1516]
MRPIPGPALRLRGGLGPTQLSRPAVPPAPVTEEVPWLSLGLSGAALLALLPLLLSMPRQAGVTAGAIAVSLLQMAVLDAPPEQALLEGVLALVWSGVITLKEALAGFASEGVVAVGVMSAATGGLAYISRFLLGRPSSRLAAVLRLVLPTMLLSAVLNNTPVCAMLMPVARSWAASLSPAVAPKQLMMPLSFATMLGGTITLIGSQNTAPEPPPHPLTRQAARKHDPTSPMGMLGITPSGRRRVHGGSGRLAAAGRKERAPRAARSAVLRSVCGVLTGTMCVAAASPPLLVPTALSALCVLMRLGCMDLSDAWAAVNGPVLLSIALSFALGKAIEVPRTVASAGSLALLFAIYAVAIAIGAVISNNAVVVLMFPIVVRMSEASGVPWRAALYTLTMAASASFSTPVSYQTNLMVSRDADYAFADFVRFGLPLQLVCMLATVPTCYLLYK